MKIVFVGTVLSSRMFLEKLISLKCEITGVVTKRCSVYNSDFSNIVPICAKHTIPVLFSNDINSEEEVEWVKAREPDIIFCFGFSSLLKTEILQSAPLGVVGFHPANLPKNRGRHPIIWTLVLGLSETASTFFMIDEGADSGDIISQEGLEVLYEDTAALLYAKIMKVAIKQLERLVNDFNNNSIKLIKQNDSQANYWRKRNKFDGKLDFRMSSSSLYNLVRALGKPYPGAFFHHAGVEVPVYTACEIKCLFENYEPGKIIKRTSKSLDVKCGHGAIRLLNIDTTILPSVGGYLV